MTDVERASPGQPDPLRLTLLHTLFDMVQKEFVHRASDDRTNTTPPTNDEDASRGATEAAQLCSALRSRMMIWDDSELGHQRYRLARAFLLEVDRRMAGAGSVPVDGIDFGSFSIDASGAVSDAVPRVGLVSLPWMSPTLPSIQLATLASALAQDGIESDVHELYVDYAERIGLNLYSQLDNLLGFLPEWIFSRHYYAPENGNDLSSMIEQNPLADIPWPELGASILNALEPITQQYLDEVIREVDWSRYDVVGCSLTISQLGASMAFARQLKLKHPAVRIIFGGSQCAGPMGSAILRICPYVDVVVRIEGELVLPELVRRIRRGQALAGLPGLSYRSAEGAVVTDPTTDLFRPGNDKLSLNYDSYFQRLLRLGLTQKLTPWLPFESSRGCWYGQKVQCTFCGLHEIMEFRAWEADAVLEELERLQTRYGIGRFYCMDLILPREYFRTLLPEIAKRGHDWMFFYEIKANMRRSELKLLADAGVRWVQPGIESLDADLLKLMRKGVRPFQNILLLKWSEELGIFCGWNLLFGLPGEKHTSYAGMAELIPKLTHLRPPSGGGQFQLHRFSPYFDHPEDYGIRWTGAHPMYRHAFPVPQAQLDELVYLHEFTREPACGDAIDTSEVEAAVHRWRRDYRAGATLTLEVQSSGSSVIVDHRTVNEPPRRYVLSSDETELYCFLDGGVSRRGLAAIFKDEHPTTFNAIGGEANVEAVVCKWLAEATVVAIDGKILALALHAERLASRTRRRPATTESELYDEHDGIKVTN